MQKMKYFLALARPKVLLSLLDGKAQDIVGDEWTSNNDILTKTFSRLCRCPTGDSLLCWRTINSSHVYSFSTNCQHSSVTSACCTRCIPRLGWRSAGGPCTEAGKYRSSPHRAGGRIHPVTTCVSPRYAWRCIRHGTDSWSPVCSCTWTARLDFGSLGWRSEGLPITWPCLRASTSSSTRVT